ncbi:MAG: hypothetical protein U0P30_06775 [Vicinamibacterales bacterium]
MALRFVLFFLVFVLMVGGGLWAGPRLLRLALGDRREPTAEEWRQIEAARVKVVPPPAGATTPTAPLELRLPHMAWVRAVWLVVALPIGALVLAGQPDLLYTRFLAWPVAFGMVIGALVEGSGLYSALATRVVASSSGIEVHAPDAATQRVEWRNAAGVRLVEWMSRRNVRQGTNAPTTLVRERLTLSVIDAGGRPLLQVEAPLRPAAAYDQLLAALPFWTGHPVTTEQVRPGEAPSPVTP